MLNRAERVRLPELREEVATAVLTFWALTAQAGQAALDQERKALKAEVAGAEARATAEARSAGQAWRDGKPGGGWREAKEEAGKLSPEHLQFYTNRSRRTLVVFSRTDWTLGSGPVSG